MPKSTNLHWWILVALIFTTSPSNLLSLMLLVVRDTLSINITWLNCYFYFYTNHKRYLFWGFLADFYLVANTMKYCVLNSPLFKLCWKYNKRNPESIFKESTPKWEFGNLVSNTVDILFMAVLAQSEFCLLDFHPRGGVSWPWLSGFLHIWAGMISC